MKSILVSGASGIVGYGVLRSLKQSDKNLRLVGTSIYEDSVAQGFCDVFEKAPLTNSPEYLAWLLQTIRKHHIDFIIPGIEVDVYKWVEHVPEIEQAGAKPLLNDPGLIGLCRDKWLFYEELVKLGSPYAIETSVATDFDLLALQFGLPFLLKPRRSYGSRGIVRIDDPELFARHRGDIGPVLMAQPIVGSDNEEYTTSVFGDGNGGIYAGMTLRRTLAVGGYTEKATAVTTGEVDEAVSALCRQFRPIGPTNFQFRRHGGICKLLEMNPRVSSSTSIRTAFGYNECQMAVDYFLENKRPVQPHIRQGRAVRYVEDFIFHEDRML